MISVEITVLVIFILTYVGMLMFQKIRAFVALGAAVLFVLLTLLWPEASGLMPFEQVLPAIDWNVLMMLAGTMITVSFFIDSQMPARLSDMLLNSMPNVMWAVVALALFAGLISAFLDNVATVLMVAPVGLAISKKLKISPVPVIIAIAVSSNLQGAATLVGDTTSILLGNAAGMDFLAFFAMRNGAGVLKPGICWGVQIGAVFTIPVLLLIFRKLKKPLEKQALSPVNDYFPTFMLLGTVLLLILASFIPGKPGITNGLICCGVAVIGLIRAVFTNRTESFQNAIAEIDFFTLLLLASLFVIIKGVGNAGIIRDIAKLIKALAGGNVFALYTLIVWASVFFSAFIDNIPYTATMLPIIAALSRDLGIEPYVLYFGLLMGATLGGNITPVGASANIAGIGLLRKEGYEVKNSDFFKIGIPLTIVAVLAGYIYIWLVWRP